MGQPGFQVALLYRRELVLVIERRIYGLDDSSHTGRAPAK
jgi:hypothetical protein